MERAHSYFESNILYENMYLKHIWFVGFALSRSNISAKSFDVIIVDTDFILEKSIIQVRFTVNVLVPSTNAVDSGRYHCNKLDIINLPFHRLQSYIIRLKCVGSAY